MDRLIGTGVALVTPFDEQQRIDRESLYRLVNYVIDGGVDFLVALGTTAETATCIGFGLIGSSSMKFGMKYVCDFVFLMQTIATCWVVIELLKK